MFKMEADSNWLRQSFLLPSDVRRRGVSERDYRRRIYTNGLAKFSDTTLGGNQAINPAPQPSRFTDINERRIADRASKGMGRWYSEVIDNQSVLVHMRFGVPQFNSLTSFFGSFYSSDASNLARTGRGTSLAFRLGMLGGMVAQIRLMPALSVIQFLRFLFGGNPNTKYYYSKPTMAVYWNAVQTIANTIASNMGFVAGMSLSDVAVNRPSDVGDQSAWNKLLPDVYNSNGSIDLYKVGTRYQRLADARYQVMQKIYEESSSPDVLRERMRSMMLDPRMYSVPKGTYKTFNEYYENYFQQTPHTEEPKVTQAPAAGEDLPQEEKDALKIIDQPIESVEGYGYVNGAEDASLSNFLTAELRDGAQFVTFKVDNPGSISESFGSSFKESAIAEKINNMSNSARDFRFNFANGNIASNAVTKVVGAAVSTVTDLLSGVAASFGVSGLATLAGNALVDIPKYWDGSTSNLPRISFTIDLRSIYGNDLCRYQNLMVPLTMLLAGALPRSTGFQSYTAPFLVELFCKGRMQTRLGMIDSIEITRGTGNVGWDSDGKPLGIDVTFSVVDLSTVVHMPITNGFNLTDVATGTALQRYLFNDETSFTDYMAVLSSMGLADQVYTTRRLKRNFYRTMLNFNSWTSPAHFASWVTNASIFGISPGRIISGIAFPMERN